MLIITGKIVMIKSKEIVKSSEDKFMNVTLVIVKQMKKVKRNICFQSYGKIALEILKFRKGDKIRIWFTIDSILKGDNWYHNLKAVEVEKCLKENKEQNNSYKLNFTDDDTFEKNFT